MGKIYRLSKAIKCPGASVTKGTISIGVDSVGNYYFPYCDSHGCFSINPLLYPDWFEEVTPQQETQDGFAWNDKLVKEFIIDRNNGKPYSPVNVDAYIQEFKSSKQQPISKEWEIVSVIHDSGLIHQLDNTPFDQNILLKSAINPEGRWEIHSVRRLSDGEVLIVGELTQQGEILKFEIVNSSMVVDTCRNNLYHNRNSLLEIKKSKPSPPKKELDRVSTDLLNAFNAGRMVVDSPSGYVHKYASHLDYLKELKQKEEYDRHSKADTHVR